MTTSLRLTTPSSALQTEEEPEVGSVGIEIGKDFRLPFKMENYDRSLNLTELEQEVVAYAYQHPTSRQHKQRKAVLQRLIQPLEDVLNAVGSPQSEHFGPIRVLLGEMNNRKTAYWGWSGTLWLETIGHTRQALEARYPQVAPKARQQLVAIAYLLTDFTDFLWLKGRDLPVYPVACTVFGKIEFAAVVERICTTLSQRGYSKESPQQRIMPALAVAFLLNHSSRLEDLTLEVLAQIRHAPGGRGSSKVFCEGLNLISRALVDLGIFKNELGSTRSRHKVTERIDSVSFSGEWLKWIKAWHHQSHLTALTKETYVHYLCKVGLWLDENHPQITSPEQWDYALALEFTVAVANMKVGDYVSVKSSAAFAGIGKEFTPRTKNHMLTVMRRFFSDLQEIPHRLGDEEGAAHCIARNFNPLVAFQTPPSILNLIGPDPRIIEDSWWWKLNQAALNLTEADLPRSRNGFTRYPFEMVRAIAITWCYAALRSNEIKRLRIGCIRREWGADMQVVEGERIPEDATCFLHVPVNKTNTAFWKPVYALVGTVIKEWEEVRPAQPAALDSKTNEMVHFLFSYRGEQFGRNYLNRFLIPMLCEKAGVPLSDTRGRITSHRARATLATLYYNCPEGLSGPQIQEFLGHRNFRSTQSYIKASPTKLAKAVARANKNSRLVKVLVDPKAVVQGEPAIFYDLGDNTFCGNPAWASCAHRMACIKCPMHIGAEMAQLIRAREGIMHLLQEVPNLSQEERAVAEGDREVLERLIEKYKEVEPPAVPDARYIFNPAALKLPIGSSKSRRTILLLTEKSRNAQISTREEETSQKKEQND